MKKRDEFRETISEHNAAINCSLDLMDFMLCLDISVNEHNRLAELIDNYVEECEQGAYIKGAKEKPEIKEYMDGQLIAIYNEGN